MTYVMSDIHGNKIRFESILKQIDLKPSDRLYILGDVVDRFPDGIELLQRIRKMKNAVLLLGNHEYMMINSYAEQCGYKRKPFETERARMLWARNHCGDTARAFKVMSAEDQKDLIEYLMSRKRYLYITVNGQKYLLVHGASPKGYEKDAFHTLTEYVVWNRVTEETVQDDGSIMIFGHTPTVIYHQGEDMTVWYGKNMIGIDCGSGYYDGEVGTGCHLACLRLDDMKEFYSE